MDECQVCWKTLTSTDSATAYLLIYCLVQQQVYQSQVHDVEELLDIWHGLQHSAVDTSAIDGERFSAPAYGPKDILSSDNMLIQ